MIIMWPCWHALEPRVPENIMACFIVVTIYSSCFDSIEDKFLIWFESNMIWDNRSLTNKTPLTNYRFRNSAEVWGDKNYCVVHIFSVGIGDSGGRIEGRIETGTYLGNINSTTKRRHIVNLFSIKLVSIKIYQAVNYTLLVCTIKEKKWTQIVKYSLKISWK